MKKILLFVCILFSFRANIFSITFSDDVLLQADQNLTLPFPKIDEPPISEGSGTEGLAFLYALFGIGYGVYFWLSKEIEVCWYDYPYQTNGNLSFFNGKYVVDTVEQSWLYSNKSRFSLDSSALCLHGFGFGNETRFEGLVFPLAGLCVENLVVKDFGKNSWSSDGNDLADNLKIGLQLSIIQTDFLSASLLIQYSKWYGTNMNSLYRGRGASFILRSYPVKPIVLEWKVGWQNYHGHFRVYESDLHLGVMLKRFEIFAAWKTLDFSKREKFPNLDDVHGVSLGVRTYFSPY